MRFVRRVLEEFRLERGKELEESKKRQEEREKLLEETVEIYTKSDPQETLRFLLERGLPRSTARYWVFERILRLLKQGGVNERPVTS
jgi:hypothetical protein